MIEYLFIFAWLFPYLSLCLFPKPAFVLGFPSEFLAVVGTKYAFVYCVPFLSQRDVKVGLFFSHLTSLKQSNERESKSIAESKVTNLNNSVAAFLVNHVVEMGTHATVRYHFVFCPGFGYGPRRKKR